MIEKYLLPKYIRKYFYIFIVVICIKFSSNENFSSKNKTSGLMFKNDQIQISLHNNKSSNSSSVDKIIEKKLTKNASLDKPDIFRQKILLQMSKIGRNNSQPDLNNESNRKSQVNNPSRVKTKKGIKHIESIYNTFKNGKYLYDDPQINTVRFIPSIKADTNKKTNFLFNLSLINSYETLLKAELYINKKYVKQKLTFDLHFFMYSSFKQEREKNSTMNQFNGSLHGPAVTIELKNVNNGKHLEKNSWEMFDLADSVQSYLSIKNQRTNNQNGSNVSENSGSELVLIMESLKSFNKASQKKKSISEFFNPYIIIYCNEKEASMRNFFQNKVNSLIKENINDKSEEKKIYTNDAIDFQHDIQLLDDLKKIEKEKLLLNKTINKKEDIQINNNFNLNSLKPPIFIPKSKNFDSIENLDKYNQEMKFGVEKKIEKINLEKFKRDLKNSLSNETNDTIESQIDDSFLSEEFIDDDNVSEEVKNLDISNNICEKKSITIDFEDISFSNWIIQPKRFSSNYCLGTCGFKSNQKKVPITNYATIQGILSTLKINIGNSPPELCCTPSETDSLPIFYTDKNNIDLVVKKLPEMIVKECSCR